MLQGYHFIVYSSQCKINDAALKKRLQSKKWQKRKKESSWWIETLHCVRLIAVYDKNIKKTKCELNDNF